MKFDDLIQEDEEDDKDREKAKFPKDIGQRFFKAWKVSSQRKELIAAYHSDLYPEFDIDDVDFEDSSYHLSTGLHIGPKGAAKLKDRDTDEIDLDIEFTYEDGVVEIVDWHEAT